jgi:cysteine synthase B
MNGAIVPKIYDPSIADANFGISTEDAHEMARRLAREEGILVGISAGAAAVGCVQIARALADNGVHDAVLVTVFPDAGDKYLSERFWGE